MVKNIDSKKSCDQCGACCHMQILMTILDIHRIARFKEKPDRTIFNKIVGDISNTRNLFLVTKKEKHNECIFLNGNNLCKIQQVKPNVCRFYQCSHQMGDDKIDRRARYRDLSQKYKLWEQSIASKITEKYIDENGNNWNKEDYFNALNSIKENIQTTNNQRSRLNGLSVGPVSMLYDCYKCDKRGECNNARPVTLCDVQRIAEYLDISGHIFFEKYISSEKCLATGGLKLKRRDKQCIFFNYKQQECSVKEVRPLHCRFVSCPFKTKNTENRKSLYLGSDIIEGKFRHQVALQITREYVSQSGINYSSEKVNYFLNQLENAIKNPKNLKEFIDRIKKYRYESDTVTISNNPEKDL